MASLSGGSKPAISLVGFMGAGKSTAAPAIADALGEPWSDSDAVLEQRIGMTIAEAFEARGEAWLRDQEQAVVLELLDGGGVVALGGGAVETPAVSEALRGSICVWCEIDEELAWERCGNGRRPLAQDRDVFRERFARRQPLYREPARAVLPATGREEARLAAPWIAALRDEPEVRLAWATGGSSSYPALVGPGATRLIGPAGPERRWFAVADGVALAANEDLLPPHEDLIEVEAGEERKTLTQAEDVLRRLANAGARRDDGLIAFGGGVVGDLAGFCAAVYQRGVPVVQVPTTLVAQIDSAYGGKTGVDLPEAKNYAGIYHQPAAVLADPAALRTLPEAELAAGFAELVKTALIAGGDLWERVRSIARPDPELLGELVFDCARVKLAIVAADERDAGPRQVLNLGHTVGHAIEQASGYTRYRHGEAIALGLLAALRLSDADGLRDEVADLLERSGLPGSLDPSIDTGDVVDAVQRDKKATREGVPFVLLERPGAATVGSSVSPDRLRAAVEELR